MGSRQAPAPPIWLIAGVGACLCAAFVLPISLVSDGPTTCPFLLLTGLPCPTCGMTRSWVLLGHGQWARAVEFNALAPAVMALAALWFVLLIRRRRGNASPPWFGAWLVPLVAAAVAIYGVSRIVLVATGRWQWIG